MITVAQKILMAGAARRRGGGGDPYWNNVVLLLHGDGTNGSTTFTDSSIDSVTLTSNGGAQITTSGPKFPSGCFLFDGVDDYISATIDGLDGTEDFTIECFVNTDGYFGSQYGRGIITLFNGTLRIMIRHHAGSNAINIWCTTTGLDTPFGVSGTNTSAQLTPGTWSHLVFVRSGNGFSVYIDGVSALSISTSALSFAGFDSLMVGKSPDGGVPFFDGKIDELRITKGVARYTGNFTPPTAPFPNG